jgi:hypothetical protein
MSGAGVARQKIRPPQKNRDRPALGRTNFIFCRRGIMVKSTSPALYFHRVSADRTGPSRPVQRRPEWRTIPPGAGLRALRLCRGPRGVRKGFFRRARQEPPGGERRPRPAPPAFHRTERKRASGRFFWASRADGVFKLTKALNFESKLSPDRRPGLKKRPKKRRLNFVSLTTYRTF